MSVLYCSKVWGQQDFYLFFERY